MQSSAESNRRAGRWSARTQWDLGETPWARHLARLRGAGAPLFDLTASNPTECGFVYDAEATLAPLQAAQSLHYHPDPRGLQTAREAVSRYYLDLGTVVSPERIFLTTSTSEAYSFLFRLLCDPGDEVLIGVPGYPLFDFLAQLDDVSLVPYQLFYDHGWHLDFETIRRAMTPRTRAIVIVHPNNPTGHFTRAADRLALQALCRQHGLALIVDEVFLDYGPEQNVESRCEPSFASGDHPVPTFVLSGLSKVAALPQMKASWLVCLGPAQAGDVEDALNRLEVIADTFLSMSAPIQAAMPAWLQQRALLQEQIRQRVANNLAALDCMLGSQSLMTRLEVEAGWYAILRLPALQGDEKTALDLLVRLGVVVHPGGFFGFVGDGWLVLSLLGPELEFASGVRCIREYSDALVAGDLMGGG